MTTRQLSEAEKIARVPGIIFADGAVGRRARIAGTGLDVWELIAGYKGLDQDRERLADAFDWLKPEQIQAALNFYATFPEEIDERLRLEAECFEDLVQARTTGHHS